MSHEVTGYEVQNRSSLSKIENRKKLYDLFRNRPMPDEQLLTNLALYMRSGALAKILFVDELYQKILNIPGVIMEFGVWWGQSLVLFENLRAVHEPYNFARRIIGFDTFEGYLEISDRDVQTETIKRGGYTVSENYRLQLEQLLEYHEQENVMSHIKKCSVYQGDASLTVKTFLDDHPETVIALAYLDMALYEPTKAVLNAIKPRLIKGSVICLDEFNSPDYPGETLAYIEAFGLLNNQVLRSKYLPDRTYVVIE